jgi:hypothetical protein
MDKEERLRDYLKRASADLQRSRQRVADLEAAAAEPIAIVGMSCRFPGGVTDPDGFWEMLAAGGDGIGPLSPDRGWSLPPDAGGGAPTGGFLDRATEFDAGFFNIAPRCPWSRSSGCCWKPRGKLSNGPGSTPPPYAVRAPPCSSARCRRTIRSAPRTTSRGSC